jgi:hypothetical protein
MAHSERSARGSKSPEGAKAQQERFPGRQCFAIIHRASHYRELADHARQLAQATWQDDLENTLRCLARDFDEIADDIEADATEVRHPEPSRWALLPRSGVLIGLSETCRGRSRSASRPSSAGRWRIEPVDQLQDP